MLVNCEYNVNLKCGLQRCYGENYYVVWSILESGSETKPP